MSDVGAKRSLCLSKFVSASALHKDLLKQKRIDKLQEISKLGIRGRVHCREVISMLKDSNPKVREQALQTICTIEAIEAVEDIESLLKYEQDPTVIQSALTALHHFDSISSSSPTNIPPSPPHNLSPSSQFTPPRPSSLSPKKPLSSPISSPMSKVLPPPSPTSPFFSNSTKVSNSNSTTVSYSTPNPSPKKRRPFLLDDDEDMISPEVKKPKSIHLSQQSQSTNTHSQQSQYATPQSTTISSNNEQTSFTQASFTQTSITQASFSATEELDESFELLFAQEEAKVTKSVKTPPLLSTPSSPTYLLSPSSPTTFLSTPSSPSPSPSPAVSPIKPRLMDTQLEESTAECADSESAAAEQQPSTQSSPLAPSTQNSPSTQPSNENSPSKKEFLSLFKQQTQIKFATSRKRAKTQELPKIDKYFTQQQKSTRKNSKKSQEQLSPQQQSAQHEPSQTATNSSDSTSPTHNYQQLNLQSFMNGNNNNKQSTAASITVSSMSSSTLLQVNNNGLQRQFQVGGNFTRNFGIVGCSPLNSMKQETTPAPAMCGLFIPSGYSSRNIHGNSTSNQPIHSPLTQYTSPNSSFVMNTTGEVIIKRSEEEELDKNVKLSEEQERVLELARQGKSFFFTGPAGCGKSFVMQRIIRELRKIHGYSNVFITAPTGIAACNIGGCTIHSFAGIGIGELTAADMLSHVSKNQNAVSRWQSALALIIDEVSMLSGDLLDSLDYVAKSLRESELPFGGIQVIMCGDFFQLPPVEKSKKSLKFCFESAFWKSLPICIELSTVFRQRDEEFISVLNEIREGRLSMKGRQLLERCTKNELSDADGIQPTKLHALKRDVEKDNVKELTELKGEEVTYVAADTAASADSPYLRALEQSCPAPTNLSLKIGAQVILLRNIDFDAGLVNGARGVVVKFKHGKREEDTGPLVRFSSGKEHLVCREEWKIESGGVVLARRKQIPLNLAWSLSIHKSQGMSIEKVQINLGNVFEYGMAYVALSRATSLAGLQLLNFNPNVIKAHPKVLKFHQEMKRKAALLKKESQQQDSNSDGESR